MGGNKKYASDSVRLALYDLRTDPGETLGVKEYHPEIVRQLMSIVYGYRKELGDDLTNKTRGAVRPAENVPKY